MANTFVPILSLPLLPGIPTTDMFMPIQAAGVTWRVNARSFPLASDTLLTAIDQTGDLPNSRRIVAGSGIAVNLATPGQVIISSAGASGGPIFFNNVIVAVIASASENDYNPGAWNGGLDRSGMRLTPNAGGSALTGIDASAMLDGQTFQLMNLSTSDIITLVHESGLSLPGNRFALPLSADFSLLPNQCVEVVFETTTGRLRILT